MLVPKHNTPAMPHRLLSARFFPVLFAYCRIANVFPVCHAPVIKSAFFCVEIFSAFPNKYPPISSVFSPPAAYTACCGVKELLAFAPEFFRDIPHKGDIGTRELSEHAHVEIRGAARFRIPGNFPAPVHCRCIRRNRHGYSPFPYFSRPSRSRRIASSRTGPS